jgi:hypothetical protein
VLISKPLARVQTERDGMPHHGLGGNALHSRTQRSLLRYRRCLALAIGLAALFACPLARSVAQDVDDVPFLLATGDTAEAIDLLRERVTNRSPAAEQCLLATLLTRTVTSLHEDWQARAEAKRWFDRSLRKRNDALCLLEYSGLMEKQGIRVDAARLAGRAFDMIAEDSTLQTPALLAEVYYRRALPLVQWVREFEHLVFVHDLPVSTPDCLGLGYFCESLVHADDFRARLRRAPGEDSLVADKRVLLGNLLDSALQYDPTHAGALRLALREAAVTGDWERYAAIAQRARQADTADVGTLLTVLSAQVRLGEMHAAEAVFDSIMDWLGPQAMARYEGLALVADTSMRERLAGRKEVIYGEAVWGLSDPLYLTAHNERRMTHYARIVLADVLYTDPASGVRGRDTPQGRLIIRYGLPLAVYAMPADRRLQITPEQRQGIAEALACAQQSIYMTRRQRENEGVCVGPSIGHSFDAGGRWEFWYYGDHGPPFIFERALGSRTARHMFHTESEHLDSLLHRAVASTYQPPFHAAPTSAIVTAFPRPQGAVLEVWGTTTLPRTRSVDLGIFVHDRTSGRMVADRRFHQPWASEIVFSRRTSVPWGKLRVAAEAATPDLAAAGQARAEVDLEQPGTALTLSGLLLGDSATAPASVRRRQDVQFFGRGDSTYAPGAPLALYWEIYGLSRGDTTVASATARYRVTFGIRDAENRPVAVAAVRALGRLLGLERGITSTMAWDVEHASRDVVDPQLVSLTLPDLEGIVRLLVTVEDTRTGDSASAQRVVELRRRP